MGQNRRGLEFQRALWHGILFYLFTSNAAHHNGREALAFRTVLSEKLLFLRMLLIVSSSESEIYRLFFMIIRRVCY